MGTPTCISVNSLFSLLVPNRCEELLEVYLQDTSPEAVLQLGGDMRKIKYCFALMKVSATFTMSRHEPLRE